MTACELFDSADIEVYFYGELDPVERARVERHLRSCEPCRNRLEDLHAIRRALASRPVVDAPPAGDWSGFMRRLDSAVAREVRLRQGYGGTGAEPTNLRTFEPSNRRTARALLVLAATLALVTAGVLVAMRVRPVPATRLALTTPAAPGTATAQAVTHPDRALREGSVELLERSKLVVLALATRDPHARPEDWQYERALAGTLLSDTRLYRQAAIQDGVTDVARVMRDLETVLVEASMSDRKDGAALERVQRLIAKRDLVVKMQVMAAVGPAGN